MMPITTKSSISVKPRRRMGGNCPRRARGITPSGRCSTSPCAEQCELPRRALPPAPYFACDVCRDIMGWRAGGNRSVEAMPGGSICRVNVLRTTEHPGRTNFSIAQKLLFSSLFRHIQHGGQFHEGKQIAGLGHASGGRTSEFSRTSRTKSTKTSHRGNRSRPAPALKSRRISSISLPAGGRLFVTVATGTGDCFFRRVSTPPIHDAARSKRAPRLASGAGSLQNWAEFRGRPAIDRPKVQ